MARNIQYSEKYADDLYEYRCANSLVPIDRCHNPSCCGRHVILPHDIARDCPKDRLLSEDEWRGIGVQQSRGWEHYAIHK